LDSSPDVYLGGPRLKSWLRAEGFFSFPHFFQEKAGKVLHIRL